MTSAARQGSTRYIHILAIAPQFDHAGFISNMNLELKEDLDFYQAVHKELKVRIQKVIHLNMKFNQEFNERFFI